LGEVKAEVDMARELDPFIRQGTENELSEVGADEVLKAIAEGRYIDIRYAVIRGDLDMRLNQDKQNEGNRLTVERNISILYSKILGNAYFTANFNGNTDFCGTTFGGDADFSNAIFISYISFNFATFSEDANFSSTTFNENADFINATFSRNADFSYATFGGDANFRYAIFDGDADFGDAIFKGKANFRYATFNVRAHFVKTTMKYPASFLSVRFRENAVRAGLKNHILCPFVKWLTRGRVNLSERPVTDFSEFNTSTIMDGSTNPYLKRYIDDEQWIKSWRKSTWWRQVLFIFWEATSHCGKSIGLWVFWSVVIAVAFGFIYRGFGCDSIAFNVDKLNGVQPDFRGYIYYSVVTFTTLGFGDIVPLTNWARLAVGAEVVLGYVMLGGLISIFANKFARRS